MIHRIQKTTLLISFALLVFSCTCRAQLTRLGGGLSFSTGIENAEHKTGNPALTGRAVLELGEKFWLLPTLQFYLPGKRQGSTTLFGAMDADFTYTLATEKTILFYALAGMDLTFIRTKYDVKDPASKVMPALNVGTGIEMIIEEDLNAYAQIKAVAGTYSQYIVISIGVHYYMSGRRYKSW